MLVKTLSVKTDWLARPIVASGFHFINHKILYRKYTFVFTKNVNTAQLNNNWKINVQKFEILELWREEGENTWDLLISAQLRMCIHKNPQQLHALTCFKLVYQSLNYHTVTVLKVSKYRVVSGPYFSAFGVNTERYEVSLRIHSDCGKIRTRNNSVFGHFSRSAYYSMYQVLSVYAVILYYFNIFMVLSFNMFWGLYGQFFSLLTFSTFTNAVGN